MTGLFPAWEAKAADNTGSSHHSWSALAAPDTGFSESQVAYSPEVDLDHNHSSGSLPTQFFANNDNVTKTLQNSATASDSSPQTTGKVTSLFTITINPPLVNVDSPGTLSPGGGVPVVVAPEPDAFLSALLCLFILCLLKVLSGWRRRGTVSPTSN